MPRETTDELFERFRRLLDVEQAAERARTARLQETLSPVEREARGVAWLDVESVDETWGLGGRLLVDLERPTPSGPARLEGRLGPGDLVALRPRKTPVDEPARAIVARRTPTRITVAFERPPPDFVHAGRLIVDMMPSDATWNRARANLDALVGARGDLVRRRELLVGNETPRFAPARPFAPSRPLNPEQAEAVALALAADDFFLVHGPPGTGKSTVLAEVAVRAVADGARVLATAPSNAAVDHLLELCLDAGLVAVRVGHPARVAPRLVGHTLDLLVEEHDDRRLAREIYDEAHDLLGYARRQRRQGRSRARFANAREAHAEARRLLDEARGLERRAVRAILDGAQVVCATLATLPGQDLAADKFDLALVDEATQALAPVTLLAWPRARRVVLAGDPFQLGPTLLAAESAREGLGESLFERLLRIHGPSTRRMLREQYRMHERIMAFPSATTYGGELRAHPSVATRTLGELLAAGADVDAPPVLFLDTAGRGYDEEPGSRRTPPASRVQGRQRPEGSDSLRNPGEADLVVAHAARLVDAGLAPSEIAIIAPYSAQVAALRERLRAANLSDTIETDTVDAFQGREKEAVLVTLVRSSPAGGLGFLEDLRRINVALTRAKRHLFVVGDSATLARHDYYRALVASIEAAGGYRSAWEWR